MTKSLKVLFIPNLGVGNANSCIGMAQVLISAGHRVMLTVNDFWSGKFVKYGIEEVLLAKQDSPIAQAMSNVKEMSRFFLKTGNISAKTPLEKALANAAIANTYHNNPDDKFSLDKQIEALLPVLKPDVIVLNQVMALSSVYLSGIPIVWAWSAGPLTMLDDPKTPPFASGLSAYGNPKLWQDFREARDNALLDGWTKFNDSWVSKGLKPLEKYQFRDQTNCLVIYGFPAELDYTDVRPLAQNYIQFDNLKRTDDDIQELFKVPKQLVDKPGKLVYFSLGSMGAADVMNMKRLVGILSKSKHRFIVSKGPLHDEFDLYDNMWGQESVSQLQVLPLVDLVITHGGNNTISESMYFGKPMIVLPLFSDQYDNAQQIHDKRFGIRLDAYLCSEDELLNSIESLLNNKDLTQKLHKVSQRIQSDNSLAKLPQIIEDYVENRYKYIN